MRKRFTDWWRAPTTRRNRVDGVMVGLFAGFWIGAFGRIMLGALPVSGSAVLVWAVAGALATGILGLAFPKAVTVFLFPFAVIGTGP